MAVFKKFPAQKVLYNNFAQKVLYNSMGKNKFSGLFDNLLTGISVDGNQEKFIKIVRFGHYTMKIQPKLTGILFKNHSIPE